MTLGPGCSWLLANSNTNGYTGLVNQTYAVGITDDGGIALAGPGGIVDSVGLSAGSAFGEGTRLANFGGANSNRSYERGGDTDNNAADFHLIAPSTPQTLDVGCNSTRAPTNPAASGAASPATVAAGDNVLLQAAVTPGTSPASTGLSVAASTAAIGVPGTVALVDNGTQGDVIAGDNVFARLVTVAAGTSAGGKTLPITDRRSRQRWPDECAGVRGRHASMRILPALSGRRRHQ